VCKLEPNGLNAAYGFWTCILLCSSADVCFTQCAGPLTKMWVQKGTSCILRSPDHQAGRVQGGSHVSQLELDGLEIAYGLSKLLADCCMILCRIHAEGCSAQAACSYVDAASIYCKTPVMKRADGVGSESARLLTASNEYSWAVSRQKGCSFQGACSYVDAASIHCKTPVMKRADWAGPEPARAFGCSNEYSWAVSRQKGCSFKGACSYVDAASIHCKAPVMKQAD